MPIYPNDETRVHERVAQACGVEAADLLCRRLGGRRVYIPRDPQENSRLSRVVGLDLARAISKELGAGDIIVPLCDHASTRRRRRITLMLVRSGKSNNQIAAALRCHTRTVTRIRRDLRQRGLIR